ncbi:hypothetical protein ACTXT7_017341 [Hymenolepis weldensis]
MNVGKSGVERRARLIYLDASSVGRHSKARTSSERIGPFRVGQLSKIVWMRAEAVKLVLTLWEQLERLISPAEQPYERVYLLFRPIISHACGIWTMEPKGK